MNLVKTGRWIFVDITLLYVLPVYYVYYGRLCWIKLSESNASVDTAHSIITGYCVLCLTQISHQADERLVTCK